MTSILFRVSAALLLLVTTIKAGAQTDTVRVMVYNLLNYGNNANPYASKDPRLTTILQHVQPDILGVNEVANNPAHTQNILTNVLGTGWSKGTFINTNNEVQTNMLFWKSNIFGLKSEQSICSNLRDIIAYKLYYKDTITVPHDTVYLTVIVAHLKASQGSQEEADRAAETQAVASYLNSLGEQGNYLFMGDLNLYTDTEQAYQNLINSPNPFSKLYDPINKPGAWHDDVTFADIHTQSTRTEANMGDGGVTGGLDDRFDFQLVSGYIMNNTKGVRYIPNTYTTVGQDGLHFNDSLTAAPTNNSAPPNVIQALFRMSDHLPVYADYRIHASSPVSTATIAGIDYTTTVVNPIQNGDLNVVFDSRLAGERVQVSLYSIDGRTMYTTHHTISPNSAAALFHVDYLSTGMYFLRIQSPTGYTYSGKILNN